MYKKLFSLVFALGLLVFGANTALAVTPSYLAVFASNVGQNSATLNATFNPNGLATDAWFEVQGQGGQLGYQNLGSGNAPVTYDYDLTGLSPNTSYTFRGVAQNSTGVTFSPWETFTTDNTPPPATPTVDINANPSSVPYNDDSTISWSSTNTTSCNATGGTNGWAGAKATSGSFNTGNLINSTTYTITCTGPGGSATDSTTVTVGAQPPQGNPPTVTINAGDVDLPYGGSTDIYWYPNNATSCTGTGGTNGWAGSKYHYSDSFYTGNLYNTVTYTIQCSNAYGTSSPASVTVHVAGAPVTLPTVDLSANPTNLTYGNGSTLSWTSQNADSCNASNGTNGWSGTKSTSGTFYSGSLYSNTTYTITCTNSAGSANDTITISVQNQQNYTPSVTTNSATNVGQNSATLNGYVSANGGSNVNAWFQWGTNGNLTNQTNQINYGSTSGTTFNYSLGGLAPNTTYYFRAVAQNANGQIVYGNQLSFTTNGNGGCTFNCGTNNPNVTTYFATNVASSTATLNGYLEPYGQSVQRWFQYGTSSGALYNSTNRSYQINPSNYSSAISGLAPNTTYYFRAVAQNPNGGLIYGNVASFRTTGGFTNNCGVNVNCTPTAVTTIATNVDHNSGRLNGLGLLNNNANSVNTNGYFEWGTTTGLGRTTTNSFIGNQSSNPFYASLFGLTPNTTYYFRAVVTNQYGTDRGEIRSFRTGTAPVSGPTDSRRTTGANANNQVVYTQATPVTNVISTIGTVGTSKASLVYLTINRDNEVVRVGQDVDYTVSFKNVSGEFLNNIVLQVVLPSELSLLGSTAGNYSRENHTLVITVPTLAPQQEGSVVISTRVENNAELGETVVVAGNLAYTVASSGSQEEVFAYSRNVVENGGSNLAGAALFGSGFLPNTLVGWMILILVILLLIWGFKMATERNSAKVVRVEDN